MGQPWSRLNASMAQATSFAPFCGHSPVTAEEFGFSFARTVNLHAADYMDGSQTDGCLRGSCEQRGGAGNAMDCAMRQKAVRSCNVVAEPLHD